MSYAVKYRLEFSDETGIPKKLEILKKNYSGSVIDMIGGAEPVVVKWTANDDEYSPIIGSQCEITLLETPTVSYDEFFDADEREYLVKVFYQYAGTGNAIWNLTEIDYEDADFNWEATTATNIPYWQGFIVNDNFAQVVKTQPFEIKLKAFDGLGLLDAFDMAKPNLDDVSSTISIFQYVYTILQNTGLDLAIYYSNDISFAGANYNIVNNDSNTISVARVNYLTDRRTTTTLAPGASTFIPYVVVPTLKITGASNINNVSVTQDSTVPAYRALENVFPDVDNLYKPGEFFNDAKTQLSNILKSINSRVFQSRSRWYIISNSGYSGQAEKDAIATSAASGTIPSNIRQTQQNNLETNGTENIQFVTYATDGTFSGIVQKNVLYRLPQDVQNIGADLVKRQSKQIKEVNLKMNVQNENRLIFSPNNSFEYTTQGDPNFGYTLASNLINTTTMGVNPVVKTGNQSVKGTGFVLSSSAAGSGYFANNINLVQAVSNSVMPNTLRFCYYLDVPDDMIIDAEAPNQGNLVFGEVFEARLFYQFRFTIGSDTYYYRESDNTYQKNSLINNRITLFRDDLNKWLVKEVSNLPISDAADVSNQNITMIFEPMLLSTNIEDGTNGGFNGIYFDDVYFGFQGEAANNIVYHREVTDTFTGKKDISFDYTGHNTASAYFRPRDNNPSTYKQLNEITSQQVLNDNRAKVTEFEGTLRNKITNGNPLGFESKVFVDFDGAFQSSTYAPVSGIIDQMEYRVKSNRYKIKFRLPNQDNDKANTLTIKQD